MRVFFRLTVLGLAGFGAKTLYDRYINPTVWSGTVDSDPVNLTNAWRTAATSGPGVRDTATGTDPNAKYSEPGYQDKSLGQAVAQDEQLVDRLLDETGGDMNAAEQRFAEESAGAPTLAEQEASRRS